MALGVVLFLGQCATRAEEAQAPNAADDPLRKQIDEAISVTSRRFLTAGVHTPWQIMHGVLALRKEFKIKQDDGYVNALEWAAHGARFDGVALFEKTPYGGRAHTYTRPKAFEGHPNQFQAIMTMCNLPLDYEFQVVGGTITMQDMVNNAKMDVNAEEETTWTLWFLSHYLPPDAKWQNKDGQAWSIERLVEIQTFEDPNEQACGGCHALFALSSARNAYLRTGKPLQGVWINADRKIKRYLDASKYFQNQDGSFSTEYFNRPGFTLDFSKRLEVSGHMLEWIVMSLPEDELKADWVRSAVGAVSKDLLENKRVAAECGSLYHGLHGLVLYRERVWPQEDEDGKEKEAKEAKEGSKAKKAQAAAGNEAPRRLQFDENGPNAPVKIGSDSAVKTTEAKEGQPAGGEGPTSQPPASDATPPLPQPPESQQ